MDGKRFGILLCANDSDYVKKKYGGYYGVFVQMLAEEGSCCDAYGNDVWICNLLNLLLKLVAMKKQLLGICFGHQILGRALGGKIGRASTGWDIGVTKIHLSPSSQLFSSLKMPAFLSVIECHRDEVWELPPNAEVVAWSEKTGVEMFKYSDHILGIQGHPEYSRDILLHLVDRLQRCDCILESYADKVKSGLAAAEPDRDAWKKLCTTFLKRKL
ncbi:gamma-glutamyl peptidase 5-like isoform X2 [Apium graveolens]|uniref:gamma-glutamyl peptidase 5-like isoform X2 n=1 Tax=Apium graveolens TaxID=4045 RepID=UPI003D78DAD2